MKAFFQDKTCSRFAPFQTLDYAPHLHSALEMGYLEKGKSLLWVEGECFPLEAGDFFLIFPNLIHSFEKSEGAEGYLAILVPEDLAPFQGLLSEEMPLCPTCKKGEWEEGVKTLFPLAATEDESFSHEIRRGWCRVIAGKILPFFLLKKRSAETPSTLREILDYLSVHATEPVTRKSLARALGISESTVSHVFSEGLKTSFPEYVSSLRLQEALRLLEETDLSVTQISLRSGFGSLRSFNRAFRKEKGSSPAAWRKKR